MFRLWIVLIALIPLLASAAGCSEPAAVPAKETQALDQATAPMPDYRFGGK